MPPQNKKQGRDYPLSETPSPASSLKEYAMPSKKYMNEAQKSAYSKVYTAKSNEIKKSADSQSRRGDSLTKAGYGNKSVATGKTKDGRTMMSVTGKEAKDNAKAMYEESARIGKYAKSLKK